MSLDTLLGVVRARACLAGPLSTTGTLHADGQGAGTSMSAMMSAASEQIQALQGQGMIEGRRATLMLDDAIVTAALSRSPRPGDEWRVASGHYAGTWVIEAANPVRGGWHRADIRWERLSTVTSAQEKR